MAEGSADNGKGVGADPRTCLGLVDPFPPLERGFPRPPLSPGTSAVLLRCSSSVCPPVATGALLVQRETSSHGFFPERGLERDPFGTRSGGTGNLFST